MPARPILAALLAAFLAMPWAVPLTARAETGPPPRSDPPGSLVATAAAVQLRGGEVLVALTVEAEPNRRPRLVFDGPRFGWSGPGAHPDRHLPELRVATEAGAAELTDELVASVGTQDVTRALRQAGIDPLAVAGPSPTIAADAAGPALRGLVRLGAIEPVGGAWRMLWQVQRRTGVPLGRRDGGRVAIRYVARPTTALRSRTGLSAAVRLDRYCLDPAALAARLAAVPGAFLTVREHAIPVGIDGRAPATATLTAEPDPPGPALLAACGPDGAPVVGPALRAAPVRPGRDGVLRLLSITAPDTQPEASE